LREGRIKLEDGSPQEMITSSPGASTALVEKSSTSQSEPGNGIITERTLEVSPSRVDVTVCILTLPERRALLERALDSVAAQTVYPSHSYILDDVPRLGSAFRRHQITQEVRHTEWIAWLDDDDYWLPHHLETLWKYRLDGDLIFSNWEVEGASQAFPDLFKSPYRPGQPTANGVLIRTELARRIGYLRGEETSRETLERVYLNRMRGQGRRRSSGDDASFALRAHQAGARIIQVPEKTWVWNFHPDNTGGLPQVEQRLTSSYDRAGAE
jgi:hypothetical protein